MSTPCSQSLRPNRSVVSEYEVSNFLGSRGWDIFSGPPCTICSESLHLKLILGHSFRRARDIFPENFNFALGTIMSVVRAIFVPSQCHG